MCCLRTRLDRAGLGFVGKFRPSLFDDGSPACRRGRKWGDRPGVGQQVLVILLARLRPPAEHRCLGTERPHGLLVVDHEHGIHVAAA
jgi:hypothetical protein